MKNKTIALIILIMAIMSEYFHVLFRGILHSYYWKMGKKIAFYWDSVIYHFTNESFTLFVIIVLRIKLGTTKGAKAMTTGLVVWFFIEWIEMVLLMFKISDARFYVNDGSWLQLGTCLTIVYLEYFGNKRLSS